MKFHLYASNCLHVFDFYLQNYQPHLVLLVSMYTFYRTFLAGDGVSDTSPHRESWDRARFMLTDYRMVLARGARSYRTRNSRISPLINYCTVVARGLILVIHEAITRTWSCARSVFTDYCMVVSRGSRSHRKRNSLISSSSTTARFLPQVDVFDTAYYSTWQSSSLLDSGQVRTFSLIPRNPIVALRFHMKPTADRDELCEILRIALLDCGIRISSSSKK